MQFYHFRWKKKQIKNKRSLLIKAENISHIFISIHEMKIENISGKKGRKKEKTCINNFVLRK